MPVFPGCQGDAPPGLLRPGSKYRRPGTPSPDRFKPDAVAIPSRAAATAERELVMRRLRLGGWLPGVGDICVFTSLALGRIGERPRVRALCNASVQGYSVLWRLAQERLHVKHILRFDGKKVLHATISCDSATERKIVPFLFDSTYQVRYSYKYRSKRYTRYNAGESHANQQRHHHL